MEAKIPKAGWAILLDEKGRMVQCGEVIWVTDKMGWFQAAPQIVGAPRKPYHPFPTARIRTLASVGEMVSEFGLAIGARPGEVARIVKAAFPDARRALSWHPPRA